jgi:hypothetical protein
VRSRAAHVRSAAIAVAAIALAGGIGGGIGGCAQFDKQLGQQWIEVTFAPNTSLATAKRITSVCSHVPNLRLEGPVKPTTAQADVVDSVRYNSTNATDAQVALLERCLGKFPASVKGFTQMDQGDN